MSSLFAAWTELSDRVAQIEGADERREQLQELIAEAREKRTRLGEELAAKRGTAAKKLAREAAGELTQLGMPKARLSLESRSIAGPTADDYLGQELYLQTNPGLPAGPLGKVPSGGEASRLSLALTIALGGGSQSEPSSFVPVMVFDEIDAGVGGRLGAVLADKLHHLSAGRSVLAISHTPQMAARAMNHYHVAKKQGQRTTTVAVNRLDGAKRVHEIAEMFGGGHEALKQAEVLLGQGI